MFSLKSYFNFLSRNKAYTAINLIGFSVALMFVILLGLYVAQESRADDFHENGERIFRLLDEEGMSRTWAIPVGDDIANRYPEIEKFTYLWVAKASVAPAVNAGSWDGFRCDAIVADSTFFSMFSYPLIAGDRSKQLRTGTDVVISEELAKRLFVSPQEAVGQPILIDTQPHIVTGVVGDFGKSHLLSPGVIVDFRNHAGDWYFSDEGRYRAAQFELYVQLHKEADLQSRTGEMADWLRTFFWLYKDGQAKDVVLEPLKHSYFNAKANTGRTGDKGLIWVLTMATLTILLFALINYVNLSVALSGFRAKEAATRRLLGGTKWQLFGNYIIESAIFCLVAFIIAFLLAGLLEGTFNRVMMSDIAVSQALANPGVLAVCVGLVAVLGAVAGVFPAMVVSRYKPIEVVRGELTRKTKMTYSRLFIGLQFLLTIVLIASGITIRQQTEYMLNKDLGFDKEQLIWMENTIFAENVPALRDRLMQVPGVKMVAFSLGDPITGGNNLNFIRQEEGQTYTFRQFWGDEKFLEIFDMEVASRTGNNADSAIWINQTMQRMLEMSDTDDKLPFAVGDMEAVRGVLKDFHVNDLTQEIRPVTILQLQDHNGEYLGHPWEIFVKIEPSDPQAATATFEAVKKAHLDFNGGVKPFESRFVDQMINQWYEGQKRTATMVGWFSILAIILSAMGLVAMATYFMRQRAREIAVRKVFGATSGEVLERLVMSFLRIVLVAFVLSVPIIWWMMREWLTAFAYRIPLGWTIFALAGLTAGVIAVGSVLWQAARAANTNPVKTLHKG